MPEVSRTSTSTSETGESLASPLFLHSRIALGSVASPFKDGRNWIPQIFSV